MRLGLWILLAGLFLPTVSLASPGDALDRRVSLTLRHASLEEVCRELSDADVQFLPNNREIGDYKVHLLVKEVKRRDLMDTLVRLFSPPDVGAGHYWARSARGKATVYRFTRSAEFGRRLEAARWRPLSRLRERLELLRDWPQLSPAQQARAAAQHPVVAWQAHLTWDPALIRLFWSDSRAGTVLQPWTGWGPNAGPSLSISYRTATPAQQRLISQLRDSFLSNTRSLPEKSIGSLEETSIEFHLVTDAHNPLLAWRMNLSKSGGTLGDLGSPELRQPEGTLRDGPDTLSRFRSGWTDQLSKPPGGAPAGGAKGDATIRIDYLFEGLRALQETSGTNFVTHARTSIPAPYSLPGTGGVEARLDGLGKQYRFAFSRCKGLVVGEDTGWFLDFETEVPVRLLARWAQHKESAGRLDLDDAAEILSLPRQQIKNALVTFPEVRGGNRWLLVWGRLNSQQRSAARSTAGLELRQGLDELVAPGTTLRVIHLAPNERTGSPLTGLQPKDRVEGLAFLVGRTGSPATQREEWSLPPRDPMYRQSDIRK